MNLCKPSPPSRMCLLDTRSTSCPWCQGKEEGACYSCFSWACETFIPHPCPLSRLVKAATQHPLVKHQYSPYAYNCLQHSRRKIVTANLLCLRYTSFCYSSSRKHFEYGKIEEQSQILKSVGHTAGQCAPHLPLTLWFHEWPQHILWQEFTI